MANEFVQTMADARVDAQSLSDFVFKPSGFKVVRRLAPTIDTLQFYINRFNTLDGDFKSSVSTAVSSLNNSVAEAEGKVAYIETTVQDAINNTAVEGGVLADTFVTATANGVGSVARTQRDKNSETLSVKDFGIKGDGTDESAKLRAAIAAIPKKGKLDFLGLTVSVNSSFFITRDYFVLENGGIKALGTMITHTEQPMMRFISCNNFALNHFVVDANRQERTPAEKAIHSIHLRSCKNFAFNYVDAPNAVCDGLYFDSATPLDKTTRTSNGVFNHCNFDNAYRNNVAIIVGADLEFNNCKFRDANGTLPMAGVDLETNQYGVDGLIENITFNNCEATGNNGWQMMVTSHDNPRNIKINGGVITSNRGQVPVTSITNTGGILVSNGDTEVSGVLFTGFAADSGYAYRTHAVVVAKTNLKNCRFVDNDSTDIYLHSLSGGGVVENCYFSNSAGVSVFSKNTELRGLEFSNSKGISVLTGTSASGVKIDNCYFEGGSSSRVIFAEGANTTVTNNKIKDAVITTSYIQVTGDNAIIEHNTGTSTSVIDLPLVRANALTARSIKYNNFKNNSSTVDEYNLSTNNLNNAKAVVAYNVGGAASSQGASKLLTPTAIPTCTTATRPSANAVADGTQVFDTSLSKIITAIAGNWYADGSNINNSDLLYSNVTTLVSVPANSTASQTITLTGVRLGWSATASIDVPLAGTQLWAEVTASDTVTIYRRNSSNSVAPSVSGRLKVKASFLS